jgi:ankyrin repeat protein
MQLILCFFLTALVLSTEKIKFDPQIDKEKLETKEELETIILALPETRLVNLFSNESSVQILRDVNTEEIYWEDPNDLIEVEKKASIKSCLQKNEKAMANELFDCLFDSNWSPLVKAFPFLRELAFYMAENVSLSKRYKEKQTPLMLCAFFDAEKAVSKLLERGANVNETDANKNTALHDSCRYGSNFTCQKLIWQGANVNARNRFGETPLFLAVSRRSGAVKILLQNGASPHLREKFGKNTPLMYAAFTNDAENVQLLLASGANIESKNKWSQTALELAKIDCVDLIKSHKTSLKDKRNSHSKCCKCFLKFFSFNLTN